MWFLKQYSTHFVDAKNVVPIFIFKPVISEVGGEGRAMWIPCVCLRRKMIAGHFTIDWQRASKLFILSDKVIFWIMPMSQWTDMQVVAWFYDKNYE